LFATTRFNAGAEDPLAFGVGAAHEFGGRRVFGDERFRCVVEVVAI